MSLPIRINGLSHSYVNHRVNLALKEINLQIEAGQFVALVGPSGCGKSTLLRLAAGLLNPLQGEIHLGCLTPSQAVGEQRIAWMAQSPALLPWLTVEANVALPQRFNHRAITQRLSPQQALERVGLLDAAREFPRTLSGGMQQRLALARTLTQDYDVWLMDEPYAALDELTRAHLSSEILQHWEPIRPTVLWVTHHLYEAVHLADRVLVMSTAPGQIILDVNVNLPHPRREDSSKFQDVVAQLRQALLLGEAA
jgi:NitT/TauT family transport system ATP-binding protein